MTFPKIYEDENIGSKKEGNTFEEFLDLEEYKGFNGTYYQAPTLEQRNRVLNLEELITMDLKYSLLFIVRREE